MILKILANWIFLIYYFLLFQTKRIKTQQTYIKNQKNQKAFIVIIINQKLRGFFVCLLCKKYYFLKNTNPKNQIILFLFCQPTDPIFFAVLPVDQKFDLASLQLNQFSQLLVFVNFQLLVIFLAIKGMLRRKLIIF